MIKRKAKVRIPGIFLLIFILSIAVAPGVSAAGDPFAADDQMIKDNLEEVKSELIAELKARGHEGLADQLGSVNPEKIGDFLGSAAGGDFDRAFNIAGSSAANYLDEKFKEQLDTKLGEWIQPDSPAATIGKYIPWDSAQAKQIAISAIRGDFSKAGKQISAMVQSKGQESLKQMSKDIVAYGIDWVLKPTVGAGGGQLFIKVIELEMAGIEWFREWTTDFFTSERREQYNALRKQGMNPNKALDQIMDNSLHLAFARYPFNGNEKKVLEYLEAQYGRSIGITEESIRQNASTAAQKLASSLSAELQKHKEENDRKLKQELLQIFARVAKNTPEIKDLIAMAKKARDRIDAIDTETEKLGAFWKKNKGVFDPAKMEARRRTIEEKLAGLDQQATAPALEKCGQVEVWTKQVEQTLDDMDATLARIREIGKETQEIVRKICENKDDKAAAKKGMLALKKRFGLVGALRRDAAARKSEAAGHVEKLNDLKNQVRLLLDKQQEISSSLDQIEKWQVLLNAAQQNVNTPAQTVDALYAEIRIVIDDPIFDRFKGERGSIRYTLLGDAAEAKKAFDKQKAEVEAGIEDLAKSLDGIDGLRDKLAIQKQNLDQRLGECRNLRDLEMSPYLERIRKMEEKDARYVKGLKEINEKAKTCVGKLDDASLSSDALKEAEKWMNRARERGGIVIDNFMTADAAKDGLEAMVASAQAALSDVSSPAANVQELIAACNQYRAQTGKVQSEIQAAISASSGHYATLKKGYETAAMARKNACEKASYLSGATDEQACRQAAAQAAAHAATARQAAQSAVSAAEKMKSLYNSIQAKKGLKAFDELLRKVPSAIQSLKEQVSRANDKLSNIDSASIDEKRGKAATAATNADKAAQKVSEIVGVIRGLLSGIDSSLVTKAEKIRAEAETINEIAIRRSRETAAAAADTEAAGDKAAAAFSEATSKIKLLMAMIDSLGDCRGRDLGGSLNELRTNSDMGEIFGPAARSEAQNATICADGATEKCKNIKNDDSDRECKTHSDCTSGYVCENGKCVSPFDSGYDDYTDTMGQRDSDRSQDRADQVASDQSSQGGRSGYTAGDIDQDIASAQDAVAGKCRKDSQCPPGYVCRGGQCVEKVYECSKDSDCDPGYVCRHGECVPKSGCSSDADCTGGKVCKDGKCVDPVPTPGQPAKLTVTPGNKAVVLNETVNLKAMYTDTDGSTKDVTAEAKWSPSSTFSKGEIGVYAVSATYKSLVAGSQITVVQEKGMDDITVNKKVITVTFWDSGRLEDGDMIDILINGKVVFPGITLTFAKQSRTITMNADVIVVGFKALNEGSSPPNTASVTFSEVTAGKETQKYSLKKHQSANMNVTYKP